MEGEICLVVRVLDELCKDPGPSKKVEYSSLWQLLPEELVSRILLFLPASSQARLRCVCKRWSQLVISSAFREECNLIAFRRGHRNFVSCSLQLVEVAELDPDYGGACAGAVRVVDFPGVATSLPALGELDWTWARVFCGAGLVGAACISREGSLVCRLFNIANGTCRLLPPLLIKGSEGPCKWIIWLEPEPAPESSSSTSPSSSFQVVLVVVHELRIGTSAVLYTYSNSSASTGWRTVHERSHHLMKWSLHDATKGGCVGIRRNDGDYVRMSWDSGCITHLPHRPASHRPASEDNIFLPISDPSTAAVFGCGANLSCQSLSLYRWDESSAGSTDDQGWTCLYSGLPPRQFPHQRVENMSIQGWQSVANMLIIVVWIWSHENDWNWYGLAYHIDEGSCKWFRLPDQKLRPSECTGVFVEPTLVSQLRL